MILVMLVLTNVCTLTRLQQYYSNLYSAVVFNTECHPFKAPPAKASYSTGPISAEAPAPFTVNAGALPAVSANPHLPKQIEPLIHGGGSGASK